MGVGQLCGGDALFIGGGQIAVADVIHHRAGEEVHILQHHAQRAAQIGFFDLVDIDAVVADLAVCDVVEAVDQVGDGGLTGAGGADEGDLLTGAGIQRNVGQHLLFRYIAEVHHVHHDVALQLGVGQRAVAMGMLPCPVTGMLVGFGDGAILADDSVYQGDIAIVGFRFLIHQIKNTLRAGHGHDDGVKLLGNLADGHVEITGQHHECHQATQGDDGFAWVGNGAQRTAHDGQDRILHITQVIVDGAHHVGELTGGEGVVAQLLIELVKFFLTDFLVVEDLDHLLSGDHFLNIAVDSAQGLLLTHEELACLAGQRLGHEEHAYDGDHAHQRQDPGLDQHGDKQHDQRHHGGNGLGNGLGNHLPQGINVAGVAGHDVTGGVGVKIAQGKGLHFAEHFITDGLLDALGDTNHQIALQEAGEHAGDEHECHFHQEIENGCKIRGAAAHHGQNVIIHQGAQHGGAEGVNQRMDQNAEQNHADDQLIFQQVFQQAKEGLLGIFGFTAVAVEMTGRCHYSSPPFCWE